MNKFIEMYNQVDLDILCAIMLLSVLIYTSKYIKRGVEETKYLKILSVIMITLLIVEPICFILEEFRIPSLIPITYFAEFINLSLCSFLGLFWLLFTFYYVFKKSPFATFKGTIFMLFPVTLGSALMLTNKATGYIFTISEQNEYARGPLFITLTIVSAIYAVYSLVLISVGRKRITRKEYCIFMLYNLLPIAGVFTQVEFQGTTFAYSSSAFALTLLYVFLENKIVKLDHLTKVYARTFLDAHIDNMQTKKTNKAAALFIDLDEFKQINDKYGHAEGDFALVKFAEILNNSMPEEAIVARFGGDEFVVILNTNDIQEVEKYLNKFEKELNKYNKSNRKKKGYDIKYSVGYDVMSNGYSSVKELIREVDDKMYQEKLRKKVNRKSKNS